jgi:hypothetical protein
LDSIEKKKGEEWGMWSNNKGEIVPEIRCNREEQGKNWI